MSGKPRWIWMVLAVGLLTPAGGRADPALSSHQKCQDGCPEGNYSRLHYWLPSLYRYRAFHTSTYPHYGPHLDSNKPIGYTITTFPCPSAGPAERPHDIYLLSD